MIQVIPNGYPIFIHFMIGLFSSAAVFCAKSLSTPKISGHKHNSDDHY